MQRLYSQILHKTYTHRYRYCTKTILTDAVQRLYSQILHKTYTHRYCAKPILSIFTETAQNLYSRYFTKPILTDTVLYKAYTHRYCTVIAYTQRYCTKPILTDTKQSLYSQILYKAYTHRYCTKPILTDTVQSLYSQILYKAYTHSNRILLGRQHPFSLGGV